MNNKEGSVKRWWLAAILVVFALIVGFIVIKSWSAIGSSLATPMRRMIGIERVAQLETVLFNLQDRYTQFKYELGFAKAESPWQDTGSTGNLAENTQSTKEPETTPTPLKPTATDVHSLEIKEEPSDPIDPTPEPEEVVPTESPDIWTLPNIPAYAQLAGEGIWEPYITNSNGDVYAYRTFLQPDPERPYTLVAVTAFDLAQTDLHFVLGFEEPAKPGGPHGYGSIPAEDFLPGKLLAAFNGGFIAEHGAYGAMADGLTALAGKAGLATLGIFKDGKVRIGEWKNDLPQDGEYQAWRQNALMIIHNGEINPKVETGTYIEWGANLDGAVVTMRSAVGLSEDNRVLYYFAGPKLSMPVLADAMAAAGVYNGMLLDINPTHAHFTAMRVENGEFVAEPLFEEEMNVWVDRYLRPWKQDFFYITLKE